METSVEPQSPVQRSYSPVWLLVTILAIATVTAFGPTERTLGENLRLVMLHGAWVWTGKILFAAAAVSGLAGLLLPRSIWSNLTLALGRAGLLFWLTYLPMSLVVQMQNWGGIFWDEPRWRVPFTFGVVGLLLQLGLWVINQPRVTNLANLIFGILLWWQLGGITNVLHPDSPIFGSNSTGIQVFFLVLLGLMVLAGAQITLLLFRSLIRQKMTAP